MSAKRVHQQQLDWQPDRSQSKKSNTPTSDRHAPIEVADMASGAMMDNVMRSPEQQQQPATPPREFVQAKLTIGEPNDKYEQEADRVAKQVVQRMRAPNPPPLPNSDGEEPSLQCKHEAFQQIWRPILQADGGKGGTTSEEFDRTLNSARSGGQALDSNMQRSMGQAIGADFSGVKVHTDSTANRLSESIQAKAFTTGRDVFFKQGAYQPGSREGQELIAHELTHVVQQNGSAVASTQRKPDYTPNLHAIDGRKIQRTLLGLHADPDDKGSELDTDDLGGIRAYVRQNCLRGRDDLNRLLVEHVRQKDKSALITVQEIVNEIRSGANLQSESKDENKDENKDDDLQNANEIDRVPNVIHLIWIGDKIGGGEIQNIQKIYESIEDKQDWKIILWTDSRKCGFLQNNAIADLEQKPKFEVNGHLENMVASKVQPMYEKGLEITNDKNVPKGDQKGGYTMMSDIGRYCILLQQGGIYMDVDLNLGQADVSQWTMEMSDGGLPAFGPNIEYLGDMELKGAMGIGELIMQQDLKAEADLQEDLENGVQQAFEKMFKTNLEDQSHVVMNQQTMTDFQNIDPLNSDEELSQKTRIAAMVRYLKGDFSNNVVAAPANHRFIKFMLDCLGEEAAKKINQDEDGQYTYNPKAVPAITGPQKITEWMIRFYEQEDIQLKEGLGDETAQKRRALIDPNWVSQLIQVEWLTAVQKAKAQPQQNNNRKDCYITTACVDYLELSDDCEELTVLRNFRDTYLLQKANGRQLIDLYYQYSPQIVTAIRKREDEEEILARLYKIIRKCVEAIKKGDREFAFQTYCKMVMGLKEEFIPECQIPSNVAENIKA